MSEYLCQCSEAAPPRLVHVNHPPERKDSVRSTERTALKTATNGTLPYYQSFGDAQPIPIDVPPAPTRTYVTRYWILFTFSSLCIHHAVQWNTWGPIAESMNAVFPGWGPSTVAMMANWGTIIFLVFLFPICWVTQRCGLRVVVVSSAALMFVGTALRCITSSPPVFTIMCHLCAILVGISSIIILVAPVLIAADWFPVHERTTATAVMMGASQLGILGSYLEPLLVRLPSLQVSPEDVQQDVMHLLYLGAGVAGVIFLVVLAHFPSKPPTPPSVTSSTERLNFIPGLKSLVKNKQFMMMLLSYGVSVGPPIAWISVLDYSLFPLGFHQDDAMWIGVIVVIASSTSPIIAGRINDLIQGHVRVLLFSLMLTTSCCFFWFLLLSYKVLPFAQWQVYVSIIGGIACNYATIPLFLEVGQDLAYPVPELLLSGLMIGMDNIVTVCVLLAFFIPNVGYLWMTYTLLLSATLSMLPLLLIKFHSTRLIIDTSKD
ncbi:solute carrier family 49 member 4 homolog [Procambarus clarkii]|uniref:solute carrier family 49 member 4 homolog n=1 Tax=Procambarus clarkii TaxID=6728 RepID=UPI001E6753A5|nr:solute carrier family 49 member 4 homolog [Procambarus clarkii]